MRAFADLFLDLEMQAWDLEQALADMQSDRMFKELEPMRECMETLWEQYVQLCGGKVKLRPIQFEVLSEWLIDLSGNKPVPEIQKDTP